MKKGKKLYEGKAKIIYSCSEKNLVIQHFKDDATAFNNQKRSVIDGKGILNNRISEHILTCLAQAGIKNHLVKRINMREQLIKHVNIVPIEFIVRNIATGSLTKRLGIEDGTVLNEPLIEYCLKNDELGDPLISKEHIYAFNWATKKEIEKRSTKSQDKVVCDMFCGVGPFAIPAAKQGLEVLANDLNPESVKYLRVNTKLNKVQTHVECFNKDGREFVRDLLKEKREFQYVLMNLPAIAIEFLDVFRDGVCDHFEHMPRIYCYCFSCSISSIKTNII